MAASHRDRPLRAIALSTMAALAQGCGLILDLSPFDPTGDGTTDATFFGGARDAGSGGVEGGVRGDVAAELDGGAAEVDGGAKESGLDVVDGAFVVSDATVATDAPAATGDTCGTAIPVTRSGPTARYTTCRSDTESISPPCSPTATGVPDIFFELVVPPESWLVTIPDGFVAAFRSASCTAEPMLCVIGAPGGSMQLLASGTYYVMVEASDGTCGTVQLDIAL